MRSSRRPPTLPSPPLDALIKNILSQPTLMLSKPKSHLPIPGLHSRDAEFTDETSNMRQSSAIPIANTVVEQYVLFVADNSTVIPAARIAPRRTALAHCDVIGR